MTRDLLLYNKPSAIINVIDTTNIERIEFLPYHKLGSEKYLKMNLKNPYLGLIEMNKEKCDNLYKQFMSIYEK